MVHQAFPTMRIIDGPVAEWRRHLLWSSELQPPTITYEASIRSSSLQAKTLRDREQKKLDRQSFLIGLFLRAEFFAVHSCDDPRFARCLDLTNKTNQFNTTGKRWTIQEFHTFFRDGGFIQATEAADKHSIYGLVCVAFIQNGEIIQYMMSCRVFGLDLENASLAAICEMSASIGWNEITGRVVETGRNGICLQLFERNGFEFDQNRHVWVKPSTVILEMPAHIKFVMHHNNVKNIPNVSLVP